MSGSAVKAERREIRRAVGEQALSAMGNLEWKIQQLGNVVGAVQTLLGDADETASAAPLFLRVKTLEDAILQLANARQLQLDREREITRSLWTRLKWLITGRPAK